MSEQSWILYDSRAAGGETHEAAIYETCQSAREAKQRRAEWPDAVCYRYDIVVQQGERVAINETRVY